MVGRRDQICLAPNGDKRPPTLNGFRPWISERFGEATSALTRIWLVPYDFLLDAEHCFCKVNIFFTMPYADCRGFKIALYQHNADRGECEWSSNCGPILRVSAPVCKEKAMMATEGFAPQVMQHFSPIVKKIWLQLESGPNEPVWGLAPHPVSMDQYFYLPCTGFS